MDFITLSQTLEALESNLCSWVKTSRQEPKTFVSGSSLLCVRAHEQSHTL